MRTFTRVTGEFVSVWCVESRGDEVVIRPGLEGGELVETRRRVEGHATEGVVADLVRSVREMGYLEKTEPADAPRRAMLEAAVAADPDDRAARFAYADLLAEEGDPLGELIHVQANAGYLVETGVVRFLGSGAFPNLTDLCFRCSGMGDRGVAGLVRHGWLDRLRRLDLRHRRRGVRARAARRRLAETRMARPRI